MATRKEKIKNNKDRLLEYGRSVNTNLVERAFEIIDETEGSNVRAFIDTYRGIYSTLSHTVDLIEMYDNYYTKSLMDCDYIVNLYDEHKEELSYMSNLSEEEQLNAVRTNPKKIYYVDDPSEEMQIEAIKANPEVIEYIKNPTEQALFWANMLK